MVSAWVAKSVSTGDRPCLVYIAGARSCTDNPGVLVGSVAAAIILIFFIIVMYIYGYYPFAHKCWNCRKRVRSKDTVWVPRVVPKQTGALKKDDPKRVWDWTKRAIETDNEGNSKIYMCSPAKGCDGRNLLGMLFGRKSKMPEDPDETFIRDRVIPHR